MNASFAALSGLALSASVLVIACSGGNLDDIPGRPTTSGTSSSGSSDSSDVAKSKPTQSAKGASGYDVGGDSSYASSGSSSGTINTSSLGVVTVGHGYCGASSGECMDRQSFTINFKTSELTHTRCVELEVPAEPDGGSFGHATQNVSTTRALTAGELQAVRDGLAGIRTTSKQEVGYDGGFDTVDVDGKLYSPLVTCGDRSQFTQITSGFGDLWNAVKAL